MVRTRSVSRSRTRPKSPTPAPTVQDESTSPINSRPSRLPRSQSKSGKKPPPDDDSSLEAPMPSMRSPNMMPPRTRKPSSNQVAPDPAGNVQVQSQNLGQGDMPLQPAKDI